MSNNGKILFGNIVRLALFFVVGCRGINGASITGVRLVGDSTDYISLHSTSPYSLQCQYRTGYDDPVSALHWYKNDRLVYTWREESTIPTVNADLFGKVDTTGENDPGFLTFLPSKFFDLDGNYTCEVVSKNGRVKSEPYPLVVLDVSSDDFASHVTLMSDLKDVEKDLTEKEDVQKEDVNCTLIWDFKTPAIYPKPNVTCGYYFYLHDDITDSIPAGLTMHQFSNGSWKANFDHTHVQVASIPRERRLGCSVRIPFTSYKKVIKFEDNFAIDHLIDSRGCPAPFLHPDFRLTFDLENGQMNCRGDLTPTSDTEALMVHLSCREDEVAIFLNGSVSRLWSFTIICDQTDFSWRGAIEGGEVPQSKIEDVLQIVPICVPNNSARSNSHSVIIFSVVSVLLTIFNFI